MQVETLGNPGWKTSDWCSTARAYSALTAIPSIGSHAVIINLGLNDKNANRIAAAFKADLKTIASKWIAANADVILAIPHTCTVSSYNLDATYVQAIFDAASELGLASPIDLRTIGLVSGDYFDGVHLTSSGYAKVGQAYFTRLTA